MAYPIACVRERSLIEAKQFLFQHPFNVSAMDPIDLLRSIVKEYEAHLSLEARARVNAVANGDFREPKHFFEDNHTQSVSPIE